MSKWFGKIGYSNTEQATPGEWQENVIEKEYFGDIMSNKWNRMANSESVNDNISITSMISIVADPFVIDNCSKILYVEYCNSKWKVTNIDIQYPRLNLTLGGLYNE